MSCEVLLFYFALCWTLTFVYCYGVKFSHTDNVIYVLLKLFIEQVGKLEEK
jgi:hypothetical protein